ncbi:MAG TPA: hypothetical protein EYM99_01425 [Alphaproteobacteria bacterium]|jgi:hypothetical protein|nr:hypothetical protein [Alphaproteobacteria bacterium]
MFFLKDTTIGIHANFYPESYLILIEEEGTEFNVSCSYEYPDGPDRVVLGSDFCLDKSWKRPVEIVTEHTGLSGDDQVLILNATPKCLLGM